MAAHLTARFIRGAHQRPWTAFRMIANSHRPVPKKPHDEAAEAKARLAAHLVRTGAKHSHARDAVVDAFLATKGHVSVEELTAIVRRRTPGVGYTTVYRALKVLAESGLAAARQFGDGHARYERILEGTHHDHLICTECGVIVEFEDLGIEKMQEAAAQRHGFEITNHKMEIYGRCVRCVASRHRSAPAERKGSPSVN